jgi:histidine kinase
MSGEPTYEELEQRVRVLEKEVEASEEKYRALFEYEPNSVFLLELGSFKIRDVNTRALATYGYDKEELVGRSFLELRPVAYTEGVLSTPETISTTLCSAYPKIQHRRKDGGLFYVDVYACRTKHSPKYGIIATTVDITESLIKETQLIQASKMATLGEMATGVAHELNQPLSVIKTASSFLIKKVKNKEEIKAEILKTLAEEVDSYVDRASKIISHMREFGRKSEVKKEVVHVNEPLVKALELFCQQLKLRDIQVVQHLEEGLPTIMADSNRLEQVFINLLINARDAIEEKWERTPREGKKKEIFIETRSEGNAVVVEVKDTGIGMKKGIAEKIFDPFFTTKKVDKGTGLGLSISYGIIKDYGGTIAAESQENKGTSFKLSFPVADRNEQKN